MSRRAPTVDGYYVRGTGQGREEHWAADPRQAGSMGARGEYGLPPEAGLEQWARPPYQGVTCTLARSRREGEIIRVPTSAKVEVARRYSGNPKIGPTLWAWPADLDSCAARWKMNGYPMSFFYQQLAPALEGEAKEFYINSKRAYLNLPEVNPVTGQVVMNWRGAPVPLQDPLGP